MIRACLLLLTLILGLPVYAGIQEVWEPFSNPTIMSYSLERNFLRLPLKGEVLPSRKFWSGDYWALNKGSINYRWYSKNKTGFNNLSPSKKKVLRLSIPELAELSPAEKYDLFTGNYHYPLTELVKGIADPKAQIWEGMCHGWSPATMNHEEPTPKLLINPDGIEIPFGSTDIKALLSFYYAYQYKSPDTHQMGRRCFKSVREGLDKDCGEDLNAGAFHLVLTNRLGLDGQGLILDLEPYKEVWNHPATSYSTEVLKESGPLPDSAPGTFKNVFVRTKVTYVDEKGHDWHPVIGTPKQSYQSVVYEYRLELNDKGEIIGGLWLSRVRPDFLWIMRKPRSFEGILGRLGELLNDQ